jgi:hypothetical protein
MPKIAVFSFGFSSVGFCSGGFSGSCAVVAIGATIKINPILVN